MWDFLKTLLEQAQKSKVIALGVVAAALLFIGAPRYAPGVLPPVPDGWAWVPWAALVVIGVPLLLLLLLGSARLLWRVVRGGSRWFAGFKALDADEVSMLLTLGAATDHTIHLGRLALFNPDQLALALQASADKLTARGLITRNPYDADLCSLSRAGRKRTLALQQARAASHPRPLAKGDWVRNRASGQTMCVVETIRPLHAAVQASALPVVCEWHTADGQLARGPFHPGALERIAAPQ